MTHGTVSYASEPPPLGSRATVACDAGYYLDIEGTDLQLTCVAEPGVATAAWDRVVPTCVACATGYYSLSGALRCSPCPVGTYAPERESGECKPCEKGHFCGGTAVTRFLTIDSTALQRTCQPGTQWHLDSVALDSVDSYPFTGVTGSDIMEESDVRCKALCMDTVGCTHAILRHTTTRPTTAPTAAPSASPSVAPTAPTAAPSASPSVAPTVEPTMSPTTTAPTISPTAAPTAAPTAEPVTRRQRRQLLETTQSLTVHCDLCRVDDEDSRLADVLLDNAGDDYSSAVRIFQGARVHVSLKVFYVSI